MSAAGPVLLLLLAVAAAQPADGAASPPAWGVAVEGNPVAPAQLENVVAATGLKPALVLFFQQWPERPAEGAFPRASVDAIAAAGAVPVVSWEPMYYGAAGVETMVTAEAIVRGDYDNYLAAFAREAAAWGHPLLIRFAHEMNLSRYHWGTAPAAYGPAGPLQYQVMWRHVVEVFRRTGAANVRWAFAPNCESVPGPGAGATWNTARAYYPGHDYVDVLGMDGYNWGDTQKPERNGWRSSWRSFGDTFRALRDELRALAPGKPLYVFETASAPTGGDKAAWLAEMTTTASAWGLAGVVWFEVSKEVDWRLRTGVPAAALEPLRRVFRAMP
jgi:mannan endo-1,4-beta-mannosidase